MNLLALVIVGLVVGLIAGAMLPKQSLVGTLLVGIAGSFLGAMAGSFITTDDRLFELHAGWLVASCFGAVAVIALSRISSNQSA